jgi:hypothetical protein
VDEPRAHCSSGPLLGPTYLGSDTDSPMNMGRSTCRNAITTTKNSYWYYTTSTPLAVGLTRLCANNK